MSDSSEEKPHEPSQRRLEEARKKGEVPRSQDITTASSYGALLLVSLTFGAASLQEIGTTASVLLGQADRLAPLMTSGSAAPTAGLMGHIALATLPLFLLPALGVLGALMAQRSLIIAPEKLMPRLDRVSPITGFQNRFGRNALFEFGKSFLKLVVVGAILAICIQRRSEEIIGMMEMEPAISAAFMLHLMVEFLFLVFLFSAAVGAADYLWQRAEHLRRNRMSQQEMADEMKDSEGDPHVKSRRRQRAVDIATNRMIQDVAKSDVIVVNPTHYAVALKWKRGDKRAPVCVAKGVDEIAARIREKAMESGVPIHRDPPTARALHATVKIGDEIRADQYQAVAAAIRFSEAMRRKAKGRFA